VSTWPAKMTVRRDRSCFLCYKVSFTRQCRSCSQSGRKTFIFPDSQGDVSF